MELDVHQAGTQCAPSSGKLRAPRTSESSRQALSTVFYVVRQPSSQHIKDAVGQLR